MKKRGLQSLRYATKGDLSGDAIGPKRPKRIGHTWGGFDLSLL